MESRAARCETRPELQRIGCTDLTTCDRQRVTSRGSTDLGGYLRRTCDVTRLNSCAGARLMADQCCGRRGEAECVHLQRQNRRTTKCSREFARVRFVVGRRLVWRELDATGLPRRAVRPLHLPVLHRGESCPVSGGKAINSGAFECVAQGGDQVDPLIGGTNGEVALISGTQQPGWLAASLCGSASRVIRDRSWFTFDASRRRRGWPARRPDADLVLRAAGSHSDQHERLPRGPGATWVKTAGCVARQVDGLTFSNSEMTLRWMPMTRPWRGFGGVQFSQQRSCWQVSRLTEAHERLEALRYRSGPDQADPQWANRRRRAAGATAAWLSRARDGGPPPCGQ